MNRIYHSKRSSRLADVQHCLKMVMESNLTNTVHKRIKVNGFMDVVMTAMTSVLPIHGPFIPHYSNFYQRLLEREVQLAHLQKAQESRLQIEKIKDERLRERSDIVQYLEECEVDEEYIQDCIDQRFLLYIVSRKL